MTPLAADRARVRRPGPGARPAVIVGGWRRRLQLAAAMRAVLAGAGTGSLALAALRQLARWGRDRAALGEAIGGGTLGPGAGSSWPVTAALVIGVATASVVWWRSAAHALSVERAALWLEEQAPRLQFALVTAVGGGSTPPVRDALERAIHAVSWEAPARLAVWRSLRWPALLALLGIAGVWRTSSVFVPAGDRSAATGVRNTRAPGASALGAVTLTLRPPGYTGRTAERLVDPALVRAYPGSRAVLEGAGSVDGTHARVGDASVDVRPSGGGWRSEFVTGAARVLVRVARDGGGARLLALEPLVDSAPMVTLRSPARDTVLRQPRGTIALAADVRDDLGLASAVFEYIVSSGEGERFTFTSGSLGMLPAGSGRVAALRASLSLDGLKLAPGDVVHLRAVARDRNDVSGPGVGSSESRTIRIARADEYDSVAVDQAPPPEVDKSLLSQRMLINLTEALVKRSRSRSLSRTDLTAESRRIGRDQGRLRKQVRDIIFARLGDGGEGGEHFHGDGHAHAESDDLAAGPLTPEALLRAAERATVISGAPTDFEHDETPVVAINRPMLEAYNAMWDAGRALDGGEPARALPPMYVALAAIQRARAAERLYLRGAPPRVVVDLARVRLQGTERGSPGDRTPRQAVERSRGEVLARFGGALDALTADPAAGVDSLIILRLAVAERLPAAADALEGAIAAVRASRNATDALRRVRRALDDGYAAADTLSPWGAQR
ncbi:MAG: hypothetical protein IT360_24730 [Gemmatimonadaceae bacterium]|nr:hypothetical protein [Gemmatimonadaceae bacterium]